MKITHWIHIRPDVIILDGKALVSTGKGIEMLTSVYRNRINDYPKYFKMDSLSKLGFIASELLLQEEKERLVNVESRAIVFFNRSSSLCDDKNYQETIRDKDNYFPSPAIFVYTLPNIVTGEIAIRNKYYGETSFYVLDCLNTEKMKQIIDDAFQDEVTESVLGGWLECYDNNNFEAYLFIIKKNDKEEFLLDWNIETINKLIDTNK